MTEVEAEEQGDPTPPALAKKKSARELWPILRDATLFFAGLGLVIHETIIHVGPERPTLLLLFAAMMGLPAFLRTDEARKKEQ